MRGMARVAALYLMSLVLAVACTMPTGEKTPQYGNKLSQLEVSESRTGRASSIARVTVTPAPVSVAVKSSAALKVTAYDSSGNVVSVRKPSWTTSAPSVASVTSSGVVTGVAKGSAKVSATVSGVVGTVDVSVLAPLVAPVSSLSVSPSSASLAIGATQSLSVALRDSAGNLLTGRSVSWTSSSSAVATVSTSGLVAAVSSGSVSIIATSEGVSGSAAITVQTTTTSPPPSSGRWVSGYYVGYQRSLYPETSIDFSLLTHILVGAIEPTSTGGVKTDFFIDNTNGPIMAKNISARAHQFGRKAVLMLGGAGYDGLLVSATSSTNMATFVANLLSTMDNLGYDGIDVDWEPLPDADKPAMLNLLQRLRAARPSMILTVPVGWINPNWMTVDPFYVQVAPLLDQINVMSYQMADNWGGWVSWHQGALYGEAGSHPSSVSSTAKAYVAAGITASKIGIGLGFYGSCWRGPTTMLQTLSSGWGVVASDNTMSFTNILASYYNSAAYHWDSSAHAGYLAFATQTGPAGCTLISYENEQSITEKGNYVKSAGLGGAIIWTINQGHFLSAPVGQKDPLLSAAYNSIVP